MDISHILFLRKPAMGPEARFILWTIISALLDHRHLHLLFRRSAFREFTNDLLEHDWFVESTLKKQNSVIY